MVTLILYMWWHETCHFQMMFIFLNTKTEIMNAMIRIYPMSEPCGSVVWPRAQVLPKWQRKRTCLIRRLVVWRCSLSTHPKLNIFHKCIISCKETFLLKFWNAAIKWSKPFGFRFPVMLKVRFTSCTMCTWGFLMWAWKFPEKCFDGGKIVASGPVLCHYILSWIRCG